MTSEGNRVTGAVGFEFDPLVVSNGGHLVRGGQLVQAVPAGGYSWNHAHGVPYLQDSGFHGYRVATMSRNSPAVMHPHQVTYNVYQPPLPPQILPPPPPMLPIQAQNMDIQLQQPSTSHRHSTRTSQMYPYQNDAPVPRFVGPALPHGVMVYEARRQQLMINSIARHRSFSHHRVTLEEAFQALREQLGEAVDTGLPVKFISDNLKTRIFASPRHHSQELTSPADEEPNLCVICQMEFEDQEKIGMLDCCHEYHAKCIKKWLTVKNNCPVCKSTALR
ncbi:putative transcription factor C2H2 family [Helianthus annuus]|nr:putative transcription factor C2H2 family [Helianthus annuus]KAJ0479382.1 putative transcription factor C2H2 family [Helianthus annuus]KAJ0662345.1 putative transcription factor C2H2 family [Helianthus annuus]KAJ0669869.1 putative transcription factor C2H2 family [Helianthus annuus]KAJ0856580.1 putative transcription factor C2H2 family [Helianthus annuus]